MNGASKTVSRAMIFALFSVVIAVMPLAVHAQDDGGDASFGGYADTSYSDYPTSYSDYPSNYSDYPSTYSDYPTYDQQCGCDYQYDNGVGYSERSYDNNYSQPYSSNYSQPFSSGSGFGSNFSQPRFPSFSAPQSYYSNPVVYSQPAQQQQQQQQQQAPIVITQPSNPSQPISVVNNNNNTNNNSNPVTVTTVTPVASTPTQYPVQYVYSQPAPVYTPTYRPTYTYVPPTPVYTQPAPYVSLSQIPYTGFDLGTVGDIVYWISLALFALAAAYLVVYFVPKISFIKENAITAAPAKVLEATAMKIEKAVVSPIQNLPVFAHMQSKDSMVIERAHGSAAPRIVITRV